MRRVAPFRSVWLATVLATTLIAAISCGGDDGGSSKGTPATPSEVKVTDKQDGQDVRLAKGGNLIVTLDSNRTTGFAWKVADAAAPVLVGQGDSTYNAPSGPPGTGGTEIYTFTAASAGTATLRLTYQRSFEPPSTPPGRTFTLKVTVN